MEKLPPQSNDLEQAIIGALLYDKNAFERVVDDLNPEYFYNSIHKFIFEGMLELKSRGIEVDILTLTEYFKDDKEFKELGGTYYLTECISSVTSSGMLESHIKIIKEQSRQRNAIQACNKFLESEDYVAGIDKLQECLENNSVSAYYEKQNEIISLKDAITKTISNSKEKKSNILSYIKELDNKTGGFNNGEFVIIAGHTSMGKTSLAVQIFVENVCKGIPVGLISLESPIIQLTRRIISNYSGYSVYTIREPDDKYVASEIIIKFKEMSQKPGILYDVIDCNISHIKKIAMEMARKHEIKFIIIDYIQLIRSKGETQNVRVSEISREIKLFSKRLNIPIIALSQLSRPLKEKRAHKPLLFDLKESGSLEQDADKVIFIHRPKYYDINSKDLDLLIVAKNRDGETGAIETNFIQKCMRFE